MIEYNLKRFLLSFWWAAIWLFLNFDGPQFGWKSHFGPQSAGSVKSNTLAVKIQAPILSYSKLLPAKYIFLQNFQFSFFYKTDLFEILRYFSHCCSFSGSNESPNISERILDVFLWDGTKFEKFRKWLEVSFFFLLFLSFLFLSLSLSFFLFLCFLFLICCWTHGNPLKSRQKVVKNAMNIRVVLSWLKRSLSNRSFSRTILPLKASLIDHWLNF